MYFYHSLEVIINIISYGKKIELNNCYFIAIITNEQNGIFS